MEHLGQSVVDNHVKTTDSVPAPRRSDPDAGSSDPLDTNTANAELIYVGDPMCSWCWGIAPELDHLSMRRDDLALSIVVGGLRPGPAAETMTDEMAAFLGHHWREVSARSGQPFNHELLKRRGWLYDTEVPCRAVVTMRQLHPGLEWKLFKRLQHAFYAEGIIVSDADVYDTLIREFEVDADEFLQAFRSEESVAATWADFARSRRWGITGFPSLILKTGETGHLIAQGYAKADRIDATLSSLLETTAATGAGSSQPFCGPDDAC